ncbi:MAG: hypothetical protein ABW352_10515 [Polyangiales bacterium]
MRAPVVLGCLLAVAACGEDGRSSAPLLNRCVQDIECTSARCDDSLGMCTQQSALIPYDYRVRVTPPTMTDAGTLATVSTARSTFRQSDDLGTIAVPRAVFARGSVRSAEGAAIEAELVFTPRDDNSIGGARSAFTRPRANEQSYVVQLEPSRSYDVLVYPRGPDSERYPPYAFELPMGTADLAQDFPYPTLQTLRGWIRDEYGTPAARGLRVKTRYRERLLATSSIGTIGADGAFAVQIPESVTTTPAEHVLALDLSGLSVGTAVLPDYAPRTLPQNVQIEFDLARRPSDDVWLMPRLPAPVLYVGSVEIAGLQNAPMDRSAVNAQLTFLSQFVPPPGDFDLRDADWCKFKLPGMPRETFRCTGHVTTNVGPDLFFSALLFPGEYQIVVAPSGTEPTPQRLATKLEEKRTVERQTDGLQSGQTIALSYASQFVGRVLSPSLRAMPSVAVSANALGIDDDLGDVALYNRSDRKNTEANGEALLAVDVGVYDLVAAPPEGSGFAWVLTYNRRIPAASSTNLLPQFSLKPELPIVLQGSALIAGADAGVPGANVDAYALVPDVTGGPDRAVRIAHTTTDRDGKFALLMPPCLQADCRANSDAGIGDAGATDAGATDAGAADAQR